MQRTELASGRINRAHSLRVVLQESAENPPVVFIGRHDHHTASVTGHRGEGHARSRSGHRCTGPDQEGPEDMSRPW